MNSRPVITIVALACVGMACTRRGASSNADIFTAARNDDLVEIRKQLKATPAWSLRETRITIRCCIIRLHTAIKDLQNCC
jgi:hypothetical protein